MRSTSRGIRVPWPSWLAASLLLTTLRLSLPEAAAAGLFFPMRFDPQLYHSSAALNAAIANLSASHPDYLLVRSLSDSSGAYSASLQFAVLCPRPPAVASSGAIDSTGGSTGASSSSGLSGRRALPQGPSLTRRAHGGWRRRLRSTGRPSAPPSQSAASAGPSVRSGADGGRRTASSPAVPCLPQGEGGQPLLRVLLVFGQHGREVVTSEVALLLLRVLLGEAQLPGVRAADVRQLRERAHITLVPNENANGRLLVEGGRVCERRNGRGVDINRNWDVDWGVREKDFDPSEEHPGARPFSEPETRAMRRLVALLRPHAWVSVHSGMKALFTPFDHRRGGLDPATRRAMLRLLAAVNQRHCAANCSVAAGGGGVGYFAHGTATDSVFASLCVPLAFTWEIFGNESADQRDCFRMFNPTTQQDLEAVLLSWVPAFLTLIHNLPQALHQLPQRRPNSSCLLPPLPPLPPPLLSTSTLTAAASSGAADWGSSRQRSPWVLQEGAAWLALPLASAAACLLLLLASATAPLRPLLARAGVGRGPGCGPCCCWWWLCCCWGSAGGPSAGRQGRRLAGTSPEGAAAGGSGREGRRGQRWAL